MAQQTLPTGVLPRGLSRTQAAEYVGVSATLFDAMVKDGRMPTPKRINSRTLWDIRAVDESFAGLPTDGDGDEPNPWDVTLSAWKNGD